MTRRTVIDSVLQMMDGYDPNLVTEDPVGMTNDYSGGGGRDVEAAMMVMPGDDIPQNDMDMGRCDETRGFAPDDYECARELVRKVGSIERVHELLANLEDVEETLDLEPTDEYDIEDVAAQMPDDVDLPTMVSASLYDPGHSGQM